MGSIDLPQVEPMGNKSLEEYVMYLANVTALLQEEMQNVLEGRISSSNIREIAGYNVSQTELKHKSGVVGMNGADATDPEAVRFWAGDATPLIAPYRVTQAGKLTATGAMIQSSDGGYPRIYLDAETGIFAVEQSAGYGIYIVPSFAVTTPAIYFNESGATRASISLGTSPLSFAVTSSGITDISIQSAHDLFLSAVTGLVKFDDWNKIYSSSDGETLQDALNGVTTTGGASTIVTANLTANRAVISNGSGKIAVSPTTSTELGYVNGVTSAIQTQLNSKVGGLSGGSKIQSGSTNITTVANGSVTKSITFPTPFTGIPTVVPGLSDVGFGGSTLTTGVGITNVTNAGFTFNVKNSSVNAGTIDASWIAFGN